MNAKHGTTTYGSVVILKTRLLRRFSHLAGDQEEKHVSKKYIDHNILNLKRVVESKIQIFPMVEQVLVSQRKVFLIVKPVLFSQRKVSANLFGSKRPNILTRFNRTFFWVKWVKMFGLWESKSIAETFRLLNQKSLATENTFHSPTKTYSMIGQI